MTLTIERSGDFALIRSVICDPSQFRMAGDDQTPAREDFQLNTHPAIVYLLARGEHGDLLGVITMIPENAVCYAVHVALLPRTWGRERATRPALRAAIAWMWKHTPARRIVASIPAYNRLAIRLGLDAGLEYFGCNSQSFLRGGQLHDQILIGVSR